MRPFHAVHGFYDAGLAARRQEKHRFRFSVREEAQSWSSTFSTRFSDHDYFRESSCMQPHDESRIRVGLTRRASTSHTKTKVICPQNGHRSAEFVSIAFFFTEVSTSGELVTFRNSRACGRRSCRLRL